MERSSQPGNWREMDGVEEVFGSRTEWTWDMEG